DQEQLEAVLEEVVDRSPVDAGRLHRDVRAPGGRQPLHQPQQLARAGAEGLHLLAAPWTVARRAQTRGDARLVHVEPTADGIEPLHRIPRFLHRAVRRSPRRRSYACCPAGGTQQSGVPGSAWVPIGPGFSGTILPPTSTPSLHLAPVSCGGFPCAAGDPPGSWADRRHERGIAKVDGTTDPGRALSFSLLRNKLITLPRPPSLAA